MKNYRIIQDMPAAQIVDAAIKMSRSNEESSGSHLELPDLGFGNGSFIQVELAEMFFETIKDWRVKNRKSEILTLEVFQRWTRYFNLELPGATDQIQLSYKDHEIEWNPKKGELQISGGITELTDDEISGVADVYLIGRGMLSRSKVCNANSEGIQYLKYVLTYREKSSKVWSDYIEETGYEIEDCTDMDSIWVSGGTEELSENTLRNIAKSFFITDYEVDPWQKKDGTWAYELYYGPRFFEKAARNGNGS